ncbi:hypothetical protein L1987_57559 [Smallanthus sonchifolius]|uniref:Uncharacterized protein n=1 Tax=Smallanthus sonchifolius TaxID=185202 RepID=A0ACB9DDC3_9ASTR|nr:hypothetical protein L1987_57559 [Smallanthus sonchifolius]
MGRYITTKTLKNLGGRIASLLPHTSLLPLHRSLSLSPNRAPPPTTRSSPHHHLQPPPPCRTTTCNHHHLAAPPPALGVYYSTNRG